MRSMLSVCLYSQFCMYSHCSDRSLQVCARVCVCALTDQVDGSLIEGGCLQDLLHGNRLQFVWIQLFTLVRYAVVHDHRQRAHSRLLKVCSSFL